MIISSSVENNGVLLQNYVNVIFTVHIHTYIYLFFVCRPGRRIEPQQVVNGANLAALCRSVRLMNCDSTLLMIS